MCEGFMYGPVLQGLTAPTDPAANTALQCLGDRVAGFLVILVFEDGCASCGSAQLTQPF